MKPKAKIIGVGSYLPKKILTNENLEKIVETTDEWITSRTGMKERRIASEDECTSDMGYQAALKAIKSANIHPEAIDLILFATLTPDYIFPSTACLVQSRLGAIHAAAMDIQAACSGYLYTLSIAKAYVESGMYKTVLVIASEKLSSIVDYQDRNTCILFGDGASAYIVSTGQKGYTIENVVLGADGEQAEILILPAGGAKKTASIETVNSRLHYIRMEGKEVFKHAVRRMEGIVKTCLDQIGLKEEEISWLVPHQANIRIIDSVAKRFNVPKERVFVTIHKYGNTSSSSVGIALDELLQEQKIEEGEHLLLFAFGAGLTFGSAILTCHNEEV